MTMATRNKFINSKAFAVFNSFMRNKTYKLNGSGLGPQTTITANGKTVLMDVPRFMGGHDIGMQPVELLLSSLCGCEQVTAQFVARNMKPRVQINKIDFEIFGERDDAGAIALPLDRDNDSFPTARLTRIWGRAILHTGATQKEIDFICEQVKRRCPVACMVIDSGCKLEIEYEKALPSDDISHFPLSA
jgi:putative redox protein